MLSVEELVNEAKLLTHRATRIVEDNRAKREQRNELVITIQQKIELSQEIDSLYSKHLRALTLMGTATDEDIARTINNITGVINKALAVIFPHDRRAIAIKQKLYRNTYSHFEVILETGRKGKRRSFDMSGTGLAQITSFLFVMSFIDLSGGRRIIIMDEILNGLHPKAKGIIRELMEAVSNRFQFIIVEHNVDVGKQYEVVKNGEIATVNEIKEGKYYQDIILRDAGLLDEAETDIRVTEEDETPSSLQVTNE